MKIRDKNPLLKELIENLLKKSLELNAPIWKAVAKGLNRPRRKCYEVNLYKIQKYAKEKETIVVPGVVLGDGEINKPVTVAAWRFSGKAREKIEKAKGKCLTIQELIEKNPKGSGVKIMG